ncbi:hypothetical protein Cme02nite_31780 [Catellatospora methionotrophica]|uniref:Uncharacterized protein n=1 Tax=Catellatospora methionotrophica TaxID=121620 RepID=A0A8J3PGZ7_9ACTN|nr:hypothetical protein [Catellatospora methionotrophica]GIG14846.1 hypothetical protein Cme02nite_31780 [Catellatospora methionotrophica]
MNTPTGDGTFLHELQNEVEAELTMAENAPTEEEAAATPMDEWMIDPAYAQSEEVGLRNLLRAVQAVEDDAGPGERGRS